MDVPSEIRKTPVTSILLAVSHALLLAAMFALGKASCHVLIPKQSYGQPH